MRLGLRGLFLFATEVIHLHRITALAQIVHAEQWAGSVLQHILERMSRTKGASTSIFSRHLKIPSTVGDNFRHKGGESS